MKFVQCSLAFPTVAALLLIAPASVSEARSPEETLAAYVAAVQEEGITAAVRFIHTEELANFRKELEPELERRVKDGRSRQQFQRFVDPYNPKQLRKFKDDQEFTTVFLNWMNLSGVAPITTFDKATVEPLGTVIEGELRHVVARFTFEAKGENRPSIVTVTTMRMDSGQPMLALLPELRQVANMVRQGKT